MEIIPVIYILDGLCVALYKSNFDQKQTYFKSPLQLALGFEKGGAKKIMLADLNGKMKKTFEQREIFQQIIKSLKIPVLVVAGFTTIPEIEEAFGIGASQVVIRSPKQTFVKEVIQKFGPEKIIIQLQAKRSQLIDGEKTSPDQGIDVVDYAESLVPLGVKTIIYKDESSEGTLIHPNYDEIDRLYLTVGKDLKIYSSGGISDAEHLKLLKKIGAAGAIIGKAFYERMLSIKEAEAAARDF